MAIRTTTDQQNVLTIWMDAPDKSVNTCSPQFFDELARILKSIEQDRPAGIIFASAKKRSFNAGADLFEITRMSPQQVADFVAFGQSLFDRIAQLRIPTVAAINGDCLGGGFELALACRNRVAADDTSISIGLPEVKIGLIPGWGGTTRLPRTIGLPKALPILLAGKTMPPRKAQRAGLIDETVRPDALLAAARRIVTGESRRRRPALLARAAARLPAVRNRMLRAARSQTMKLTHGNYPAPMRLLDVVQSGYELGFAAGLEAERQAILDLSETDSARNLMRLFFLRQGAKKRATEQLNAKPRDVKHAAVVGGGTMGAGIVHALIRAGIPVRLIEVNPQAAAAALGRVRKMLSDDVAAGRIDRLAARHAFNRVSPTTDWTGLQLADFVVEAVLETIEAKRDVFARLDRLTRPDAVLATNTSSLSVSEMAKATLHPQRVVGLHFFNPVPRMPLVEVVRGAHSDDASLATAVALTGRIGKTPVLVRDAPGFLVNRILVPYLAESLSMAAEGMPIVAIDDAAKAWGMPMGPFELLDEIGLDIAAHVLKSLGGAASGPAGVQAAVGLATRNGWLGKKTGRGFFMHDTKHRKSTAPQVNEDLVRTLSGGLPAPTIEIEAIQRRLVQPMIDAAKSALAEGVTDSAETIDLAVVLGTGLAPFRGGIMQFAQTTAAQRPSRRPLSPVEPAAQPHTVPQAQPVHL
jgi:3-hydroxyacyl-CoA dehydrogenase/enoyl-CoA hydratase/3-hydroxybutyryl-CoA epimerase